MMLKIVNENSITSSAIIKEDLCYVYKKAIMAGRTVTQKFK